VVRNPSEAVHFTQYRRTVITIRHTDYHNGAHFTDEGSPMKLHRHRKRFPFAALLLALGALSEPSQVGAAIEHSDVSVRGMIRPSACRMTLSENGQVDYGGISATVVMGNTAGYSPGQREITLTVLCEFETRVGVTVRDNRAGTPADIAGISVYGFGLGLVEERKVGAYTIVPAATAVSEKGDVALLTSEDGGNTWARNSLRMVRNDGVTMLSWGEPGTTTPAARRQFQVPLRVDAYLPKASALPKLDKAVELDGSATLSLVYL